MRGHELCYYGGPSTSSTLFSACTLDTIEDGSPNQDCLAYIALGAEFDSCRLFSDQPTHPIRMKDSGSRVKIGDASHIFPDAGSPAVVETNGGQLDYGNAHNVGLGWTPAVPWV